MVNDNVFVDAKQYKVKKRGKHTKQRLKGSEKSLDVTKRCNDRVYVSGKLWYFGTIFLILFSLIAR